MRFSRVAIACLLGASVPFATPVSAQPTNPVYFDDSATAVDTLDRARELASIGNTDEAVRVLQAQLVESAEKLVSSSSDPDLYVTVRARVHEMLAADETLATRYRELMSVRARAELAQSNVGLVERIYLMTPAGARAAIRIAQGHMERARFHAAWLAIEQLRDHPFMDGDTRGDLAVLARDLIAYMDAHGLKVEGADRALAARWAERAGLADDRPDVTTPDVQHAITPNDRIDEIDIAGLLPKPLWSVDVGDRLDVRRIRSGQSPSGVPDNATLLYMVPAVDQDSIYLNDGFTITSWNRFSLTQRWHTPIRESGSRRLRTIRGRTFNDPNAVAVSGRWVIGVMGLSLTNNESDRTIVALDSQTGELRWSRTVSGLELEDVERGRIVGQPVIDQRTVILTIVKDAERRRLHSIYAVALDLVTGEAMWSRPLGSVGKLPYGNALYNGDLTTVERGILYRSDRIGFTIAVEAVTGRIRWARRFDYTQNIQRYVSQSTWGMNKPVIDGPRVYTLNPERTLVQVLDKESGEIVAQHPSILLGKPEYLLVCDGALVGFNPIDVYMVPIESLGDEEAYVQALTIPEPGIRGRAVASGGVLVVPSADGVRFADPSAVLAGEPDAFTHVPLDRPGIILPLDEELLVVDDEQVHTYLLWESAREVLAKRMEDDPNDAANPVTFAELAYRAGRPEMVVEATDRALAAIEREPLSSRNDSSRARLFSALLDMIDPPTTEQPIAALDDEQQREILARLELCATTPRERVAFLMASGSLAESGGEPARAIDAYQRILETETLASTMHFDDSRSLPADVEATRRLRSLVELHGRGVYASFDREAQRVLESLSNERDPAPFESLARRYPVATSAPEAWREAADRYQTQGRTRYATFALDRALSVAEQISDDDAETEVGIAGALLERLIESNQLDRAAALLERFEERGLLANVRVQGSSDSGMGLLAGIREEIARRDQRPVIGAPAPGPETILGWALLDDPLAQREYVPTDRVAMLSAQGEIAIFGMGAQGQFGKLWGDVPQATESLVRLSEAGALFAVRDDPTVFDRSFVLRDLDTGETIWKTESFYASFDDIDRRTVGLPEQRGEVIPRFDTPLRSNMRSTTMVYATSPSTLVVVGMSGLATAYDMETGRRLWDARLGVNRVHSVALDGSTLAVGGISTAMSLDEQADAGLPMASGDHLVELYDARSGVRMSRHTESSTVRWVSLTTDGDVITGTDRAIVAYAPTQQSPMWRKEQSDELERSMRGWALPGRLLVQGESGVVWQLDPESGDRVRKPLLREEDIGGNWAKHRVVRLGNNACITTPDAIRLFDREGALVGIDARLAGGEIISPAYASDRIVSISKDEVPVAGEGMLAGFELTQHDPETVRLLSDPVTVGFGTGHNSPDAIAVVDGAILVSSGALTYVIDAPADGAP